ncbi:MULTISPECIES: sensor histidine kinase [Streptomyces]|uniref:histidine kinase n=2 Tax=Streptomyces TaxID=1883 RepID=A0ABS9JK14_9ACTN|nr:MULTISPECIES: histidine kinase [Streptomyces]MCG0065902.1 histidine kinase [Streptomyces tricolor]OYP16766.1 two-component sensor histidine kinase [Streptomyces sp. FBKL.4005]
MTETTHTQTSPPGPAGRPRSPEFRLAADALRGLRQDLFHQAFAYRPLPRMAVDGPLTRHLSGRPRAYAAWTPHAVVAAGGLVAMAAGMAGTDAGGPSLLCGLLALAPVLLTLVRPVGAFWLSLAATAATSALGSSWGSWPWLPGSLVSHLLVLTVVASRTRPRTAAWMWLLTALYGFWAEAVLGYGHYDTDTAPMLVVSALALLVVTVRHIRREAEQEVTAQQTVTEHERSRRTLLEERTTIARELHDVVAHHMSVVAIQAEAAPYRVENPPPELEKAFATIRENAVAALTELRRVLGVVRAEDYEAPDAPQPTLADLDGLLANVREAGLTVDKAVTGAVRELPQGVELSAYRIVQEALSNTLRHAPGASARVEIGYVLGGLGLRIVNGPPPAPGPLKPSPGAGHGITGMRERVTMLDGEMTAAPTAEGGYEVTVFLPVPAATPAIEGTA